MIDFDLENFTLSFEGNSFLTDCCMGMKFSVSKREFFSFFKSKIINNS